MWRARVPRGGTTVHWKGADRWPQPSVDAMDPFDNRRAAGKALAARLSAYAGREDLLVLGLPRGGVPVAFEVARALGGELDVLVVRKLGVPYFPELAMGAVASGGVQVMNADVVASAGVSEADIHDILRHERAELHRRERLYRGQRPPLRVRDRPVILVDDGLATGASMRAAVSAIRSLGPASITIAVPVAPRDLEQEFSRLVDDFVTVHCPRVFDAVGRWYLDFSQTDDSEVRTLLGDAGV